MVTAVAAEKLFAFRQSTAGTPSKDLLCEMSWFSRNGRVSAPR